MSPGEKRSAIGFEAAVREIAGLSLRGKSVDGDRRPASWTYMRDVGGVRWGSKRGGRRPTAEMCTPEACFNRSRELCKLPDRLAMQDAGRVHSGVRVANTPSRSQRSPFSLSLTRADRKEATNRDWVFQEGKREMRDTALLPASQTTAMCT